MAGMADDAGDRTPDDKPARSRFEPEFCGEQRADTGEFETPVDLGLDRDGAAVPRVSEEVRHRKPEVRLPGHDQWSPDRLLA